MVAVGAAAQDRRVAGLEAERARIRRHVRAALVDDADHAQRNAHALNSEPVGPRPFCQHRTDGVRQRRDILEPLGHGLDALGVERQAVEEGRRLPPARRLGQVALVGRHDGGGLRLDLARGRRQRGILRLGRRQRQHACSLTRLPSHGPHHVGDALQRLWLPARRRFHLNQHPPPAGGQAFFSTMSSRCTRAARPS